MNPLYSVPSMTLALVAGDKVKPKDGAEARNLGLRRVRLSGEFRIVEFHRTELVDVEGDPEIQRRLDYVPRPSYVASNLLKSGATGEHRHIMIGDGYVATQQFFWADP